MSIDISETQATENLALTICLIEEPKETGSSIADLVKTDATEEAKEAVAKERKGSAESSSAED